MSKLYRLIAVATFLSMSCHASVSVAQTLRERLEVKSQIHVINMPLNEVTDVISLHHNYAFEFAEGVKTNTIISVKSKGKWKDMLTEMLKPHNLSYSIRGKSILIHPAKKNTKLIQALRITSGILWLRPYLLHLTRLLII